MEVGKKWFYDELKNYGNLYLKMGFDTFEERNVLGLYKSNDKMSESFDAHNVDSWVLANMIVGGHVKPDNTDVCRMIPIRLHRRQIHYFQFDGNGERKQYGGTMSLGFKKGSLAKHKKYGLCYIGGNRKDRLSLHEIKTGKRLCQNAKIEDVRFIAFNSFK